MPGNRVWAWMQVHYSGASADKPQTRFLVKGERSHPAKHHFIANDIVTKHQAAMFHRWRVTKTKNLIQAPGGLRKSCHQVAWLLGRGLAIGVPGFPSPCPTVGWRGRIQSFWASWVMSALYPQRAQKIKIQDNEFYSKNVCSEKKIFLLKKVGNLNH